MGWSCSMKAGKVLDALTNMICVENSQNTYSYNGEKYFFELGRENHDGRITGTVFKFLPDDMCIKVGTLMIAHTGKIMRFPAVPSKVKKAAELEGIRLVKELYDDPCILP